MRGRNRHALYGREGLGDGCAQRAAGALAKRSKLDNVGWHTFRHTYRSWLDDAGASIGVQQKLMRHSDISTTAKYGDALMESKRKHNSIVARRALGNEQFGGICSQTPAP